VIVLDASALLAYLRGESGAGAVEENLVRGAACGAANWSEVAQKVTQLGANWMVARQVLLGMSLVVEPVTAEDAEGAAGFWKAGSALSLADRLCLALGARLGADVLTCDTAWTGRPGVVVVR
jgi:ribonuclease VapC